MSDAPARIMDLPGSRLPWALTTVAGVLIAIVGFLAKHEFHQLTTSVEAGNRALGEVREGLGAIRIELVAIQARQSRQDEIGSETRASLRELAQRVRDLEDRSRGH